MGADTPVPPSSWKDHPRAPRSDRRLLPDSVASAPFQLLGCCSRGCCSRLQTSTLGVCFTLRLVLFLLFGFAFGNAGLALFQVLFHKLAEVQFIEFFARQAPQRRIFLADLA